MTDVGYKASLETQIEWLKACKYVISYRNEEGTENEMFVKEDDCDWYVDVWMKNKNYIVLNVSEINPAEIPAIAKMQIDRFAKRQYGYKSNN
jgi:hypothetical protein